MENYDVFISCKSDDYGYAEQVYEFLVSSGKKVFLASREIRNWEIRSTVTLLNALWNVVRIL